MGFRDVTRNKEGKWEGDRRHQHKINFIEKMGVFACGYYSKNIFTVFSREN